MAYPTVTDRSYSFTGFSTAQGTNLFPGPQVNSHFDNVNTTLDALVSFVQVSLDATGVLKPNSVPTNALPAGTAAGLSAPRPWVTATAYAVDDTVTTSNTLYICLVAHTSGTFSTDLAAEKWAELIVFEPIAEVADNTISTTKIVDGAVTAGKLGTSAVETAKIADDAVTAVKLAPAVGAYSPGDLKVSSRISAESGWLFAYGQSVSRTTYSLLFSALTTATTATTASGSSTLSAVATDLSGLGLVGAKIEGSGIPSGTTITAVTATTITMSANATASASGVTITAVPWGNGDGSTTFNVPDFRGRAIFGRDNMGGSAASRLTSTTFAGDRLGNSGGAQTHALTEAELAAHDHTITDAGHTHTDAGHTHTTAINYTVSGGGGSSRQWYGRTGTLDVSGSSDAKPSSSDTADIQSATTGITIDNAGSGTAHNNMPPGAVANVFIFAGV